MDESQAENGAALTIEDRVKVLEIIEYRDRGKVHMLQDRVSGLETQQLLALATDLLIMASVYILAREVGRLRVPVA